MEAADNNDSPRNAEFVKEEENVIPWRDVEYNTPFKVLEMNKVTTANGKSMIVKLQKRYNTTIKAWTTNIITENILRKVKKRKTYKLLAAERR